MKELEYESFIQIIGGSGFVGSRLIQIIEEDKCYNFDKNASPFFQQITTIGDIRDLNSIKLGNNHFAITINPYCPYGNGDKLYEIQFNEYKQDICNILYDNFPTIT